jgi:hypothetical protein
VIKSVVCLKVSILKIIDYIESLITFNRHSFNIQLSFKEVS